MQFYIKIQYEYYIRILCIIIRDTLTGNRRIRRKNLYYGCYGIPFCTTGYT